MVPVRTGAVATSGLRTGAPTSSTPAPGRRRTASPRSPSSRPDLTWADIDATAAFALGREALAWLASRPGQAGLVVWADGSSETFGSAG